MKLFERQVPFTYDYTINFNQNFIMYQEELKKKFPSHESTFKK